MFILMLIEKVHDYLHGRIKLSDLEEWLVPHLPLIFSQPKSFTTDLAATLELGLSEINDKILTEEQFRNLIKDFLSERQINTYGFYADESQPINFTTSSSKSITLIPSTDYLISRVSLVL